MYELCKTYFYDNYQVKNIIRLITLCYPCDNYIVNPVQINVNFFKIVLSRLSSEEETGTSHILLLMNVYTHFNYYCSIMV